MPFALTQCSRCGADRQARQSCPECGKRPASTEVDIKVQARQRAVRAARDARSQPQTVLPMDATGIFGQADLMGLIDHVFSAARSVAAGDQDAAERLSSMAEEVALLERWARDHEPKRPLLALTRHACGAIEAIGLMFDVVLDALAEEDLGEAQRSTERLQAALDAAAAAATRATDLGSRIDRISDDLDPFGAWLRETTGGDPGSAIRTGEELVETHLGVHASPATAVGASLHHTIISTIGDPDRYWELVREHRDDLIANRSAIDEIAADASFTPRLLEVTEDLWTAARRAAVTPEPATLRAAAGDLLETGHLIIEQPVKFHLGVACAATSRNSYVATQGADVSELVNILKDKRWSIYRALERADLRNAFAHRDFGIVDDQVSLSPRRRQQRGEAPSLISLDRLQDEVLALVEAAAAMELAILLVLDELGIEIDISPLAPVLAASVMAGLGWTDVSLTYGTDRVTISASVEQEVGIEVIGYAAAQFGIGTAQELALQLHRPSTDGRTLIVTRLDDFHRWVEESGGVEAETAIVRVGMRTTVDGRPHLSDAQVEKFIAVKGVRVLADPDSSSAQRLASVRPLRAFARECGLTHVDRELGRCLRVRAERDAGYELDPQEFDALFEIAKRDTPDFQTRLF